MNIKQLHQQFCEYQITFKGFSPLTIDGYKDALKIFLICYPDIEYPDQVTDMIAERFFYWGRTERKWTASTFITYHKRLKVYFDYVVKNGFLHENPFDNIDKPRLPNRLPQALTKQQAQKILDIALHKSGVEEFTRIRNHAIYAAFLYAGLRRAEVLKLTMDDVDLMNNRISIREGKGNKDRVVPVSQTLHNILNRYISYRVRSRKYCHAFFTSSLKDAGLTNNGLKHIQDNLEALVGFDFHIHQLRHTFATLMLAGGCNIYTLSKMLGHSDIKTTTIYLSASTELMQSEIFKHPLN